jgi:hypothetical protein
MAESKKESLLLALAKFQGLQGLAPARLGPWYQHEETHRLSCPARGSLAYAFCASLLLSLCRAGSDLAFQAVPQKLVVNAWFSSVELCEYKESDDPSNALQ